MHLAALELTLTAENWSAPVMVRSAIDGRVVNAGVKHYRQFNGKHLEPLEGAAVGDDGVYLQVRTTTSHIHVAQAARTAPSLTGNPATAIRRLLSEPGFIGQELQLELRQGETLALEKVASFYTSRDHAIAECGAAARKAIARAGSFAELMAEHVLAWKHLWRRFDVHLQPADPPFRLNVPMLLRLNMLHLSAGSLAQLHRPGHRRAPTRLDRRGVPRTHLLGRAIHFPVPQLSHSRDHPRCSWLVSGREFSAQDGLGAPPVIIINESLARSAWKGQNPVGRTLILDYQAGPSPRQVVGVVRDARYHGPRSDPAPEIFIPHAQNPYLVMNVVVRTKIDPGALARTARIQALKVDPDQPVHSVTTMEQLLDDTMQQDRFAMLLVALFAAAGLVTAATGVYALLAYTVAQRRREIAVRMAIGASSFSVAWLIVMESLMLALVGCMLGALGVAAVSRLARSVLFGIAPQDPLTMGTTVAVLLSAVLAASWLPARRAARINPVSAMRI